jgi:hypothetical protein
MGTLANVKVEPVNISWNAVDLGYIEGDIEVKWEENGVEVTAHQEGTNILDVIRTGKKVELTVVLKELSTTQLQTLLEVQGGSKTPGAGTKVSGWGSSQDFTGQLADAQKLILHPLRVAAGTYTSDLFFWKAYPLLDTLKYSGESLQNMSLTFRIFPDLSKDTAIRLGGFGDHTQTLTP